MARISPPWMYPQPNPEYSKSIMRATRGQGTYTDTRKLPAVQHGRAERFREFQATEQLNPKVKTYPDLWPGLSKRQQQQALRHQQQALERTQPAPSRTPPAASPSANLHDTQPIPSSADSDSYDPARPRSARNFKRYSLIANQFYSHGTGLHVSDNGMAAAHLYYSNTRPFGARLRSHYVTNVTSPGYRYDAYTNPDYPKSVRY